MATELRIDTNNAKEFSFLMEVVRGLFGKGRKRVNIVDDRPRRSDRQNRWYWPCFVKPFGDYLRASKPEFTDEMAHEVLKKMFLEASVVDEKTGLVFTYVRSTTELTTTEFNKYLDQVAAMLATDCGFIVPEPDVYREREAA